MESIKIPFDYSNFSRDILFEGIQPSTKDKKKRDFIDCSKCLVWEENRTRYEVNESFRKKINFYKENINLRKPNYVEGILKDTDVLTEGEFYYFHHNYPYNVPNFPQYPYLKYTYATRCKWRYDPTEGRKEYCKRMLFNGITGDKDHKIHETQKVHLLKDKSLPRASVLRIDKTLAKKITRTVPVTIHIDPLVDPSLTKQIINENFDYLMEIVGAKKSLMQGEGYQFLTKKQVEEMREIQKNYVEFHDGIYNAFDQYLSLRHYLHILVPYSFLGFIGYLNAEV